MTTPIVAVFDTNILVMFGVRHTREASALWQAIITDRFDLLISESILRELNRVLHYPRIGPRYKLSEEDIERFLARLREVGVMLPGLYEVSVVISDPTDDKFLACALEGGADYLVTEDAHLRQLKYYHGTQIVGLEQFRKEMGI
jgi:hypothetical protein